MAQAITDKINNFVGSNRFFHSGLTLGSTEAFVQINFSGTNSKFGSHGNTESNHVKLAASGATVVQFSIDGTNVAGTFSANETLQFDGLNVSGLSFRANTADSGMRVSAW